MSSNKEKKTSTTPKGPKKYNGPQQTAVSEGKKTNAVPGGTKPKEKDAEKIARLEKENEQLIVQNALIKKDYNFEEAKKSLKTTGDYMTQQLIEQNMDLNRRIKKLESALKDNVSDGILAKEEVIKQVPEAERRNNKFGVKLSRRQEPKQSESFEVSGRKAHSKQKGHNIADSDSDITHLSDFNRPTKLAKRFSEIYDNEWTDAYEELEHKTKMSERDIIEHLLTNLKDVYKFCQYVSIAYQKNIETSAFVIQGKEAGRKTDAELQRTARNPIMELKRVSAPFLVDDVYQQYIEINTSPLVRSSKTGEYIKMCTSICWMMSVHDPPVVLDMENSRGHFDGDKYRTYTKSGKEVDYVVWPPLLLHENGPVLQKGVAQAK